MVLLSVDVAYAYLDMGSGSYMIQILLASVFGVLFTLKSYWKRVWNGLISIFRSRLSN